MAQILVSNTVFEYIQGQGSLERVADSMFEAENLKLGLKHLAVRK